MFPHPRGLLHAASDYQRRDIAGFEFRHGVIVIRGPAGSYTVRIYERYHPIDWRLSSGHIRNVIGHLTLSNGYLLLLSNSKVECRNLLRKTRKL